MRNDFQNQLMHKVTDEDVVVVRGSLNIDAGPAGDIVRLLTDDHVPNRGLRLISGAIFQKSEEGVVSNDAIACKVTVVQDGSATFDASDFRQIGWFSSAKKHQEVGQGTDLNIVDPTNLVTGSLYATFWCSNTYDAQQASYMFIFKRVDLDDTQALVSSLSNYLA